MKLKAWHTVAVVVVLLVGCGASAPDEESDAVITGADVPELVPPA